MNFLLLRGLIRESRHWGGFPSVFEEKIPGAKLHFLDFPGCGTECGRRSPSNVTEIRADVVTRFHERVSSGEFPSGPWTLVAISLGAMVGMDWLAQPGAPFERAILMNTSARDVGFFWHRFSLGLLPGIVRSLADFRPEVYEQVILQATSNLPVSERYQDLETLVSWRKVQPVERRTFFAQLLAGAQFRLPNQVQVPALMLISEKDRLVSPVLSRKIAERYSFEVRRHPWAGHDLPKDDPEWVADEIRRYLQPASTASARRS